jgi:hypothetical protein
MTLLFNLGISPVSGAPIAMTAAERAVINNPDVIGWWGAGHKNDALTGGKWADRKFGRFATLVDTSKRPTQTAIGDMPVMKSSAGVPSPVFVTDDEILPEEEWAVFCITDTRGGSSQASPWAVVGDAGNALRLRTGSAGLVSLHLDATTTAIGTLTASPADTTLPHMLETGYRQSTNTAYVYRDGGALIATATVTGWTRQSGRLSFLGAWDITDGVINYGNSIGLSDIIVARVSALGYGAGNTVRAAIKAYVNEKYSGQITVA